MGRRDLRKKKDALIYPDFSFGVQIKPGDKCQVGLSFPPPLLSFPPFLSSCLCVVWETEEGAVMVALLQDQDSCVKDQVLCSVLSFYFVHLSFNKGYDTPYPLTYAAGD